MALPCPCPGHSRPRISRKLELWNLGRGALSCPTWVRSMPLCWHVFLGISTNNILTLLPSFLSEGEKAQKTPESNDDFPHPSDATWEERFGHSHHDKSHHQTVTTWTPALPPVHKKPRWIGRLNRLSLKSHQRLPVAPLMARLAKLSNQTSNGKSGIKIWHHPLQKFAY